MKTGRFAKYKDSGIEWIGEIPEGWLVVPLLKLLESLVDYRGATPEKTEDGIFLVTGRNIKGGRIDYEVSKEFVPEDQYKEIMHRGKPRIGDLLFTTEAPLGEVANVDNENIALAQRIIKMRGKKDKLDSYYLKYYILSPLFQQHLLKYATGSTALGIKASNMCFLRLILPPKDLQREIVVVLDGEKSRIDRIIQKDKQFVELLEEKRLANINQAVTRGLDPKAKLNDSGIEWIGEIPESWSLRRLKTLLESRKGSIKTGPFGSQLTIGEMNESDVKVYNQRNIISNDETIGENFVSLDKYRELIAFKAGPGDLLITTRGTIGRCLKLSSNAEKGVLHPCLMKIKIDNSIVLDDYMEFLIEESDMVKVQFQIQSNATTIDVIYQENLKNLILPIPPIDEQKTILTCIKKRISKIEKTIERIQTRIELFKEYEKALINNLVTGKVDVREQNGLGSKVFS